MFEAGLEKHLTHGAKAELSVETGNITLRMDSHHAKSGGPTPVEQRQNDGPADALPTRFGHHRDPADAGLAGMLPPRKGAPGADPSAIDTGQNVMGNPIDLIVFEFRRHALFSDEDAIANRMHLAQLLGIDSRNDDEPTHWGAPAEASGVGDAMVADAIGGGRAIVPVAGRDVPEATRASSVGDVPASGSATPADPV